jgi:hypothetical protein
MPNTDPRMHASNRVAGIGERTWDKPLGQITAFFLVLFVAACATSQPPTSIVKVPHKLRPGANESLAMIVPAKRVHIYECTGSHQLLAHEHQGERDPSDGVAFYGKASDRLECTQWACGTAFAHGIGRAS